MRSTVRQDRQNLPLIIYREFQFLKPPKSTEMKVDSRSSNAIARLTTQVHGKFLFLSLRWFNLRGNPAKCNCPTTVHQVHFIFFCMTSTSSKYNTKIDSLTANQIQEFCYSHDKTRGENWIKIHVRWSDKESSRAVWMVVTTSQHWHYFTTKMKKLQKTLKVITLKIIQNCQ